MIRSHFETGWSTLLRTAACAAVLTLGASPTASAQAAKPNIVIILADDLGYSDLGCYGGEVKTPNLDALASDGLRFTNFYNMARCCPTRASLLTGLYAHQAGIGAMSQKTDLPAYAGRLKPTAPTIAEVLKTAGYRTAAFGKWHVSNTLERPEHLRDLNRQRFPEVFSPIEQYPTRRGFDTFYGTIWGVVDYFNPFSLVDGETPVKELPEDFYITDAINQHAADFIRKAPEDHKPFFIYIAHNAPHWPLHARQQDIETYRDQYLGGYEATRKARYERMTTMGLIDPKTAPLSETLGKNWDGLSDEQKKFQAGLFQAHAAMIDRMDQGLGEVFDALRSTGQWDNTLVLFLSDNGASPERYEDPGFDRATIARDGKPIEYSYKDQKKLAGDEHTWFYLGREWANVANTPYRKAKASQYNGGERTPLIAHWPSGIKAPAGSFVRARGHVIDLMATALDIAGATMSTTFADAAPHPLQGRSLKPLFDGAADRADYPPLFGEHEGGRSVLTADGWKLVRDRDEKQWHLYHVAEDETELHDLSAEEPERVRNLEQAWETWANENEVLPKP